jgi:hypothetical protein
MSVAEAMRFVMLKKPATAAMSQMSRSVKPWARRPSRSSSRDAVAAFGHLRRELQHGALAGVTSAMRQFITSCSPSIGLPDNSLTAAPWATWQ